MSVIYLTHYVDLTHKCDLLIFYYSISPKKTLNISVLTH